MKNHKKIYPLSYNNLEKGEFYCTFFKGQGEYVFKHGYNLWKNAFGDIIKHNNGNFTPSNGFHSFRVAREDEKIVEINYEILSFKSVLGIYIRDINKDFFVGTLSIRYNIRYNIEHYLKNTKTYQINSFLRILDNVIFKVGDEVAFDNIGSFVISKITLNEDKILLWNKVNDKMENYVFLTDDLQHVKKIIFITSDEVEIYENDDYWVVKKNISYICKATDMSPLCDPMYTFSTKKKAEEYILFNEPLLSVNDVLSISKPYTTNPSYFKGKNFKHRTYKFKKKELIEKSKLIKKK